MVCLPGDELFALHDSLAVSPVYGAGENAGALEHGAIDIILRTPDYQFSQLARCIHIQISFMFLLFILFKFFAMPS